MNTSKLLSSLVLATTLGAAGCEKSPDLGHVQEETLEIVKWHATEVEVLQRRADALMQRGRTLGGDAAGIAEAGRLLSEARQSLDQLRALLTSSSSVMSTAVKSGNIEEVQHSSDEMLEKLEAGEVAVKANLAAVESWLMNAENHAMAAAPPPVPSAPPVVDETAVPPPPPAPTAPAAAGTGSGSAAHP